MSIVTAKSAEGARFQLIYDRSEPFRYVVTSVDNVYFLPEYKFIVEFSRIDGWFAVVPPTDLIKCTVMTEGHETMIEALEVAWLMFQELVHPCDEEDPC